MNMKVNAALEHIDDVAERVRTGRYDQPLYACAPLLVKQPKAAPSKSLKALEAELAELKQPFVEETHRKLTIPTFFDDIPAGVGKSEYVETPAPAPVLGKKSGDLGDLKKMFEGLDFGRVI